MSQTARRIALFFFFTLSLAVLANVAQAQTPTDIYKFSGGANGASPAAGVTFDRAGNLYGTTSADGVNFCGTVYRLRPSENGWIYSSLFTFDEANGCTPESGVVFGPDGTLYGTTFGGGTGAEGTVYNLRPPATICRTGLCPWTETVLHNFTGIDGDGGNPANGNLTFDSTGNIYGTTSSGGEFDAGAVYKLTRNGDSWTESVLHSFSDSNDGRYPEAGITFDAAGNLYGTTPAGGTDDYGTVYELSPSGSGWVETILYSFTNGADGKTPAGGVAIDSNGNLFGTTAYGGAQNGGIGTAWELTPAGGGQWTFTLLFQFTGREDAEGSEATPTLDAAGNIYGTLLTGGDYGEVFALFPDGGGWRANFYPFNSSNGEQPVGGVTLDAAGNLYGTTVSGGNEDCDGGCGVVFEITP